MFWKPHYVTCYIVSGPRRDIPATVVHNKNAGTSGPTYDYKDNKLFSPTTPPGSQRNTSKHKKPSSWYPDSWLLLNHIPSTLDFSIFLTSTYIEFLGQRMWNQNKHHTKYSLHGLHSFKISLQLLLLIICFKRKKEYEYVPKT